MPTVASTTAALCGVLLAVQNSEEEERTARSSEPECARPPSRSMHDALYPLDQCITDAQASGLEPDSLRDQVLELCQRMMTGAEPDGAFQSRQAAREGRSILDHARMLAGIMLDPMLDSPTMAGSSITMPSLGAVREEAGERAAAAQQQSLALLYEGGLSPPGGEPPRLGHGWDVLRTAEGRRTIAAAAEELEGAKPMATSSFRRTVQHLSAAMQPLIAPLSQGAAAVALGASGGLGGVAASAGVAGLSAMGGLSSSMATHEHHEQQQETSRRLQRVALEQDVKLHGEAQGLAEKLTAEAMAHETRLHRQGLWREQQQHAASLSQERRLHEKAMRVDHRLHFEGILADLREQDREADRDLWEQRTERFQMLMTVSSLFTTGGFALAVEGQLPADPGCWDLSGSGERACGTSALHIEVAALHYVLLACGFGMQLCVVMGCLALTSRFAEFMDMRVQKQQLLNKDLRRVAVKMLGSDAERAGTSIDDDQETIARFEKVLRQQYVIETCDSGHSGRHIWNFNDWYRQRCALLANLVEISFRLGMLGLLGAILTFVFAHLQRADPETSVQSSSAWLGFATTLGVLIFAAIAAPQLVGSSWMWRLRRDKLKGRGAVLGLFKRHTPVRFDMHQLSAQAEDLFNAIDTDGNGTLSERELRFAAQRARHTAEMARDEAVRSPKHGTSPVVFTQATAPPPAMLPAPAATAAASAHGLPRTPSGLSIFLPDDAHRAPGAPSSVRIGGPAAAPAVGRAEPNLDPSAHGGGGSSAGGLEPARRAFPSSPHTNTDMLRRQSRAEQAAATAVLETIIRRMAVSTARNESRVARSSKLGRLAPRTKVKYVRKAGGAGGKGAATGTRLSESSRRLSQNLGQSFKQLAALKDGRPHWEVKKEEWDEAIAEALF